MEHVGNIGDSKLYVPDSGDIVLDRRAFAELGRTLGGMMPYTAKSVTAGVEGMAVPDFVPEQESAAPSTESTTALEGNYALVSKLRVVIDALSTDAPLTVPQHQTIHAASKELMEQCISEFITETEKIPEETTLTEFLKWQGAQATAKVFFKDPHKYRRKFHAPRSLASGKRVQELDEDEQIAYQAWRKECTKLRGWGSPVNGGTGMSDERGMDFESAVFGVIVDNIEDLRKRQACMQGVMDCVRKWGEVNQLPVPVKQGERVSYSAWRSERLHKGEPITGLNVGKGAAVFKKLARWIAEGINRQALKMLDEQLRIHGDVAGLESHTIHNNNMLRQEVGVLRCRIAEMLRQRDHQSGVDPNEALTIVESGEPCDYCTDRLHANCSGGRTEYFPLCFKGRKLRASV